MPKSYSVVGTTFRDNAFDLTKVEDGTMVHLVREPTNGFDPNAVMVWIDGFHVGYIPRKQNAILAAFIDQQGFEFGADKMAMDGPLQSAPRKAIDAKFFRSPNSKFPMVEV